jgi:mRNA interferase RelE/StbE
MYNVVIRKKALDYLGRIPRDDASRVLEKIRAIAKNPYADLPFVKRLKGGAYFRFRSGDYRGVYSVIDNVLTIEVIEVGHRKDIYRR